MAIVSQEGLNNLKKIHQRAKDTHSWESAYHIAQQGLAAAISQLEQLSTITQNFEVVLKETK
jgi:hypothetical protein